MKHVEENIIQGNTNFSKNTWTRSSQYKFKRALYSLWNSFVFFVFKLGVQKHSPISQPYKWIAETFKNSSALAYPSLPFRWLHVMNSRSKVEKNGWWFFWTQWNCIDVLQQKMKSGEYSSVAITKLYLDRIAKIDKEGPNSIPLLNSILMPLLLQQRWMKKEKWQASRPLHGIPVLIKTI
jgi:hypothetical protein